MNTVDYLGAMALLALLLAALAGATAALRRSNALERLRDALKLPGQALTVVSAVALDTKTRLVLVKDGDREHLVLIGDGRLLETRPSQPRDAQ